MEDINKHIGDNLRYSTFVEVNVQQKETANMEQKEVASEYFVTQVHLSFSGAILFFYYATGK